MRVVCYIIGMSIDHFREGQFSPSQAELETIRKEAAKQGRNPDEAEAAFRDKIQGANSEQAKKLLEGSLNNLDKIREDAVKNGKDPDRAVADYLEKASAEIIKGKDAA